MTAVAALGLIERWGADTDTRARQLIGAQREHCLIVKPVYVLLRLNSVLVEHLEKAQSAPHDRHVIVGWTLWLVAVGRERLVRFPILPLNRVGLVRLIDAELASRTDCADDRSGSRLGAAKIRCAKRFPLHPCEHRLVGNAGIGVVNSERAIVVSTVSDPLAMPRYVERGGGVPNSVEKQRGLEFIAQPFPRRVLALDLVPRLDRPVDDVLETPGLRQHRSRHSAAQRAALLSDTLHDLERIHGQFTPRAPPDVPGAGA